MSEMALPPPQHSPWRAPQLLPAVSRTTGTEQWCFTWLNNGSALQQELQTTVARLREAECRFRSIVDAIADAIVITDLRGVVCFVNGAAERLFERRARDLVGQLFGYPLEPDQTTQVEVVTTTGLRRVAEMRVLRTTWNEQPALAASLRDITEGLASEQHRQNLTERLYQSQKLEALGTLAGGVAHDFNNVLTGIIGCAELAVRHTEPGSVAHSLMREIPRHARRAAELISSLLTFGRRAEISRQPTALLPAIKEIVKMLQRTLPENITLVTHWPQALPPVLADVMQVQQVIINLCTNARDAMPQGGSITVAVEERKIHASDLPAAREVLPGHWVVISVADTGVGMTPEVRARVFEPFFTTKPQGQGTGLGMATCYGIVRSHDGYIELDTAPGLGTTVSVYLPALAGAADIQEGTNSDMIAGGSETVLIVEDDPGVLGVAVAMLEALGYRTLSACNGHEALEVYDRHREGIDLVLTDMVMPGMGGAKLTDELAARSGDLRVVLITGYEMHDRDPILQHPAVRGWVRKPFNQADLAQAVRQALNPQSLPAAAG